MPPEGAFGTGAFGAGVFGAGVFGAGAFGAGAFGAVVVAGALGLCVPSGGCVGAGACVGGGAVVGATGLTGTGTGTGTNVGSWAGAGTCWTTTGGLLHLAGQRLARNRHEWLRGLERRRRRLGRVGRRDARVRGQHRGGLAEAQDRSPATTTVSVCGRGWLAHAAASAAAASSAPKNVASAG